MFSPPGPRVRRTPFVLQTTVRRGLIHRVFGAWVLLAVIVEGRDTALHSRHYRVVHSAADRLERFVIDLETATRGFLPDWRARFLEPSIPPESKRRTSQSTTTASTAPIQHAAPGSLASPTGSRHSQERSPSPAHRT